MRIAPAITLSSDQATLEQWARSRSVASGAIGGACSNRAVGRRRPTGQANRCRDEDHAQESIALALPVSDLGHGGTGARCLPARPYSQDHRQFGAACGAHDDSAEAGERHSLEHAQHGSSGGHQRGQCASYLAQSRPETAPGGELQDQQRSRERHRHQDGSSFCACSIKPCPRISTYT